MNYLPRLIETKLTEHLAQERSILLLGPRQTGKTTLIKRIPADFHLSFIQPRVRQAYEQDPSRLADELAVLPRLNNGRLPLIIIDEVQKVPEIMDVVQDLIDNKIAKFILTGSSARKLRRGKAINLLPGRVIVMHLDPLSMPEIASPISLENILMNGSLPAVIQTQDASYIQELLISYVSTYLEEEVRQEALVRNLSHFSRFLTLAASESGNIVNYTKLSQQIGVAHSTISGYYQILEDCLIAERIDPLVRSKTRKKLSKSSKYLFFDMGVRRLAASEGLDPPLDYKGHLFEQFVGLEIIRALRTVPVRMKLQYWRDPDGPEVDWVIDTTQGLIPIEVKWTDNPQEQDAKHLKVFLEEYQAPKGYVICRTPRRRKLLDNVEAIPWQELSEIIR